MAILDGMIFSTGCFDILHVGHLRFLQRASELGNGLVVGVATDRRAKEVGKDLVMSYEQRAEIVGALSCVDIVIPVECEQDYHVITRHGIVARVYGSIPEYLVRPEQRQAYEDLARLGILHIEIPRLSGISTTQIKAMVVERQQNGDRRY